MAKYAIKWAKMMHYFHSNLTLLHCTVVKLNIKIFACFWFSFEAYVYDSKNSTAYFVKISVRQIEIFYDMFGVLQGATIKAEVKTYHTFFVAYLPIISL